MCRLMAYIGPARLIADVVLWPDRSIIKQSYDARERLQDPSLPNHLGFGNLNGDGFGIGWYTSDELRASDPTPCMYKSITPAWNNENLARLSCKIVSPLVFAHVRAAYPGMPVSEQNCHPFQWGRYLWMHNGVVGGFSKIKRRLLEQLSDAAYNSIQSFHSDSAVSFAVFLNHLPDLVQQQSPDVLVNAMQAAISTICEVQDAMGVRDISLLNFVVSDGSTLIATRFVRPHTESAATLYYAEGASFDRQEQPQQQQQQQQQTDQHTCSPAGCGTGAVKGAAGDSGSADEEVPTPPAGTAAAGGLAGEDGCTMCGSNNLVGSSVLCEASYNISYRERGAHVAFVASEPITGSTTDWVCVPKNTVLCVTREKGGFLSMLQSSMSLSRVPDPRLQEVSSCLASIAQGMHTKSRAWVARKNGQQQQQRTSQQGASAADAFAQSPFNALSSAMGDGAAAAADGAAGSFMDGLLGLGKAAAEPETVSMEEEHLLTGHTKAVLALVVDEPSGRLYSSSTDATVRAWDMVDMACVAVIRGHSKPVTQLQLLGGRLLFTAAGGAVRVWDTRSFVCLAKIRTSFYSGAIRSMLVTGDGTIYVGHQDTTVKKYLPINAAAAAEAAGTAGVPFSPRASGPGVAGSVRQPDAQTNPSSGHVGPVNDLVACGSYICSAGGDTTVRVWRASDLELVRVLRGHRGSVLCLLAVGNMLLSGSRDNAIRVWDLDLDFMCRRTLLGHKDDVVHLDALGLSKSGGTTSDLARAYSGLAAGLNPAETNSAAAAAAAAGRTLSPAPGVMAAPVLVASASADGTVRVWGSNWTCLRVLTICAPTMDWGPGSSAWLEGLDQHSSGHIHPHAHQPQQQQQQQQQGGCPHALPAAAAAAALLSSATAAAAGKDGGSSSSTQTAGGLLSVQLAGGRTVKSPVPPAAPPAAAAAPGVVAVVGFAGEDPAADQQQQQQIGQADAHADGDAEAGEDRVGDLRCRTGHSSFNGWVNPEHQQQLQQQPQTPRQQQQQQQRQPGSQHKQRQRQQRRQRHRHAAPATAALVVAISSHHVVGGYSDASIRLWHMDDVYLADLTEQLMSGQMQQLHGSGLMMEMWSDLPQLRQFGASTASFNPFQALSFPGSVASISHSSSLLSNAAGMAAAARGGSGELQMQLQMQMQLLGPSPPLSPSGLAGQFMTSFGHLAAQQGQQLLSEGSGKQLGVELLSNERQRKRGVWCARLRDAGCCNSSTSTPRRGSIAAAAAASLANITAGSPKAAAAAATSEGGVMRTPSSLPSEMMAAAAAAAAGVQCLACGSQDQQLVRALKEFVAIRTVSANKALHDECLRGAKYLSRLLEALGAEVKMAQPYEGKNPVVLGRLGHNAAYPTVAFYGHYDVQPAEEPDWRTNPFEMTAVDGYLCGRGTSDNKGPVLAFIYAVKEMLDCWRMAGLAAPINVAFMFEGEEENGSLGFQESVAANLDWFKDAVLVVISNTVWVGENKPCLTYGMRGMVTASLVVSGPKRDLHSGNDGGVFSEPMADLVQLLGALHGPGGKISVPGFNNHVRPQLMDLAWQGLQHSEEFSMQSYREAIGVPELTAPPNTYDLLNKRWCSPSLSVVDIRTTTTSNNSSSTTAGPAGSSSSRPGGLRECAHSAAVAQRSSNAGGGSFTVVQQQGGRLGGCVHGSHSSVDCGGLWPSVVSVTHTEKHGAAEAPSYAAAGGADDRSCYRFGPTRFSVVPKVAVGKISLRFVPEQDHQTLIECLQQHIEKRFKLLWSANRVELQVHSVGDWWEADPQSQLFQMAERAVRREWGEPPLYVREGGTMPVASLIEKMLGAPALMIPMGQSSDNCHLANERLRRVNLIKGKNVVRHLLEEVVAASAPAAVALAGSAAASPRQSQQ